MATTRPRKPQEGDIVEIPLPDGQLAYGRVLKSPLIAFYAVQAQAPLPVDQIVAAPVAFKVFVVHSAVKSGRWKIVGHAPLDDALQVPPSFYKVDSITKALSLYRHGQTEPATVEQCAGLECAAVWSAEHVESRLADLFAGRPNRWVESLSIKHLTTPRAGSRQVT